MKITLSLAITVALLGSLCTASPLLVTKYVVKNLVGKHFEPKTVTHAVVYTPVVAPPPPPPVVVAAPSKPSLLAAAGPALKAKLTSTLGALLKHPMLQQHPWLAKFVPLGGVVEVVHKHKPGTDAPYPAAESVEVLDIPHEVEEHHTVTTVVTSPEPVPVPAPVYGVPAPAPVPAVPAPVPAPVYGVPAPTYGLPATAEVSSSAASASNSSSSDGAVRYVAVNPGARHEAPLPGYDHSVVFENLEPAPGTEGLTMLVPPVVSNDLTNWNAEPVVLRGQDVLSSEYLRTVHEPTDGEARYVAVNNGVRHEAPLPGYDRSIVIENLDTV